MKEIKVYTFNELSSKEAREKACQQVGDSMTDKEWWYGTFECFIEKCADYGMHVDEKDIYFTGFGSQGDGASFTCYKIDLEKLLPSLGIKREEKVLDYIYEVRIIRTSYRAYHEQSVHVEVFVDEDALAEEDEKIKYYIQDIADTLEFKLEKLKDDLCRQLYSDLREEYNYFYSEEYVAEFAYDNKSLFLENGLVYDWGE